MRVKRVLNILQGRREPGIRAIDRNTSYWEASYKPPYIIYYFVKGCNLFDGYESLYFSAKTTNTGLNEQEYDNFALLFEKSAGGSRQKNRRREERQAGRFAGKRGKKRICVYALCDTGALKEKIPPASCRREMHNYAQYSMVCVKLRKRRSWRSIRG